MKDRIYQKVRFLAVMLVVMNVPTVLWAEDNLDKARKIVKKTNQTIQKAQMNVDLNVEESVFLKSEIEQLESEIESLALYRNHLRKLVDSQDAELISLKRQLQGVEETRQGIVPLMYRMIDGLESVLKYDLPLRYKARQKRLDDIKILMGRADVAEAEKFRRILEAYKIEMAYGTKLGAYSAEIQVNDNLLQVEQLYFGRVSLISRSLDYQNYWVWMHDSKTWQALSKEKGVEINKAFAMAAKQQAPSVVTLPLSIAHSEKDM